MWRQDLKVRFTLPWKRNTDPCQAGSEVQKNSVRPVTDIEKCILCGQCVDVCLADAREIIGREMTVSEVIAEVEKVVPVGSLKPDRIHTPGAFVDHMVEIKELTQEYGILAHHVI